MTALFKCMLLDKTVASFGENPVDSVHVFSFAIGRDIDNLIVIS